MAMKGWGGSASLSLGVASILLVTMFDDAAHARSYRFQDVAAEVGIDVTPARSWGSTAVDYDRDGDIDLFVGRHANPPQIYTNDSGRFFPTATALFAEEERVDRHGCSWGEANQDGLPDLLCTQGADGGNGTGANKLYIQTGTTLEERSAEYGLADPDARGRTVNWFDFDGDHDLDIFVGNEYRKVHPNRLYQKAAERFEPERSGLNYALRTKSSSWSDWDRDGDPDLLVLQRRSRYPHHGVAYRNDRSNFRRVKLHETLERAWHAGAWGDYDGDGWTDLHLVGKNRSLLLRNRRGTFTKVARHRLSKGEMSVWLDADNDGDLDLFVVRGRADGTNKPDILLINRRGRFKRVSAPGIGGERAGTGEAVSVGDLTGDGRQDVFVTNGGGRALTNGGGPEGFGAPNLLENRTPSGNFVSLQLIGPPTNPLAFGARVHARAGSLNYQREVTDGYTYRTQSDPSFVHLGIRKNDSVRVVVTWPNGHRDCKRFIPGFRTLAMGSSPCARRQPGRR